MFDRLQTAPEGISESGTRPREQERRKELGRGNLWSQLRDGHQIASEEAHADRGVWRKHAKNCSRVYSGAIAETI
jgi:hypothetical protein